MMNHLINIIKSFVTTNLSNGSNKERVLLEAVVRCQVLIVIDNLLERTTAFTLPGLIVNSMYVRFTL